MMVENKNLDGKSMLFSESSFNSDDIIKLCELFSERKEMSRYNKVYINLILDALYERSDICH